MLFLLAGALVLLDTAPGHRFIVDRLGRFETASGLNIRIGRIDGSIFGKSQLRNVSVADGRGVFLTSPNIKLDWAPGAWLYNKLSIDSVTAERVTPHPAAQAQAEHQEGPDPARLRHPRRGAKDRSARHRRGGRRAAAKRAECVGKADVHSGRALIELAANINSGGDRIAFHLDAEPDRDKFDLFARVIAPANGLVPAMIGTKRAMNLEIGGERQLVALARRRQARPFGPADGALGARCRRRPLSPAGQVGARRNS